MIKVEHLTRRYGDFVAVDDVSFSIRPGEVVGLLGHNGAGKTTIMKMLAGYLEPSSGSIQIDGVALAADPIPIQRQLGYLPEALPLYPEMMLLDYLDYTAQLRGMEPGLRSIAIREAVAATELQDKAFDPIGTLSRGYRQRVGVAQAILHKPRFLILDEPTNGLDPSQTQHMRDLIRQLASHATVILSTHIMQEVNAVCDRVMMLRQGRLVVDASLGELQQGQRLRLTTDASLEQVGMLAAAIPALGEPQLQSAHGSRRRMALPLQTADATALDQACAQLVAKLVQAGQQVFAVGQEQADLESLFREVNEAGWQQPAQA